MQDGVRNRSDGLFILTRRWKENARGRLLFPESFYLPSNGLLKNRSLKNPWEKNRGGNTLHTDRMEFNWYSRRRRILKYKKKISSSVGFAKNIWNKRATRKRFDRENHSACFITWCFLPLIQTRCISRLNRVQRLIAGFQRQSIDPTNREKVPYLFAILRKNKFQISNRWGRNSLLVLFCGSVWWG